ncbi:MAG TPA: hypothetical protein VGQ81_16735 [Acidobacteriota bacterium]|nr:hypothetical protein [Acidobacteriota bacterium]
MDLVVYYQLSVAIQRESSDCGPLTKTETNPQSEIRNPQFIMDYAINADQLRTAWKMLDTLSDEYALSPAEQSFLLHAICIVALYHSLNRGELEWKGADKRIRIFISDHRVQVEEDSPHPLALHRGATEEEADAAYNMAEELLDRREMPEHERASLYNAVPCLGFHALQESYVSWKVPPPFKALISKPAKRKKKGAARR